MAGRGSSDNAWTRENGLLTTTGTGINRSYAYTSDGERVLDRNNLDSTRTVWIRDLSGKVLREYIRSGGGVWAWSKDYVVRDGLVQVTVQPPKAGGSPLVKHLHLDHLGTVRRMTDTQATPQLITSASRDLYPFGLEATSTTDPERMRFTGHQRDTYGTTSQADDLDYMHARYYNPTVGRFLSPDPVRGNPATPQSWNLYSYVQNNPVNATDPDGRLLWDKLKKIWSIITGQDAQQKVNQLIGQATKPKTGKTEEERKNDLELLAAADELPSNQGAIDGVGAGEKANRGLTEGIQDLAGPVTRELVSAGFAVGIGKVIKTVPVEQLIHARLRRNPSWDPRYAGRTIEELEQMARRGDSKARGMAKLAKEADRLMPKAGSK